MMTGRWLAAGALLALAACSGNKSRLDEANTATAAHGGGAAGSTKPAGDEAPPHETLTPKTAAPMIHELGPDRVVPTSVVIELAAPIVDRDHVGMVSADSKIKITPEVAGSLTYSAESELTFTPARPFAFDTEYKVELVALETRDGILKPASGEAWSYAFHTPKFEVLGWAPTEIDPVKHKVTMEIAFSGAVLPNVARAAMAFTIDGNATNAIAVVPRRPQNVMAVQFSDPKTVVGAKLGVAIGKGLTALTGTRGGPAKLEYVVADDKTISVKTAKLVEGGNGFYLEVVCDDEAAPPGHRSYYEGEGYYDLSQRCQLNDDALAKIHFTPAVRKTYIAGGRAGFRVFGDFKRGAYKVRIDPGAVSIDGGVLLAPFATSIAVPARRAQLSFAASGRYLPRSAWDNLGIKHVNVDAVNLIVRQIPPENLVYWMSNDATDAADERTSDVILKKEIKLHGDPDTQAETWIDVASLLPATTKGVLELKLAGTGAQATSRLMLTNMSLVAKKSAPPGKPWDQTVHVWALGMDSADLLDGVDVSLVRKSGKVVARCTTSGAAGCMLAASADGDPDQAEPFALIAKHGDDLTYIRYADLKADVTESSTAGLPFTSDTPYRAAIYSDRGVYRPGDTAHVIAILRDAHDRAPASALPVDVKVIDPRAKVVRKVTMKPNDAGVIALDEAFPAFADTGHWRVELAVADKSLGSYDLAVEEFVPERMKVTATPKRAELLVDDKVTIDVGAKYLFGGNALDSGVELNCSIAPARFTPKENADLVYGIEPTGKPVALAESRDQLDIKGQAEVECGDGKAGTGFTQTGKLTATAAVLEAGSGRATVKSTTVMLHPEKFYLGLKTKATKVTPGETFSVDGKVVDWTGKLAPSAIEHVQVELVHLEAEYGYDYDDNTGESRWDRWTRAVPEGKQVATVSGGNFHFDVTPNEADAGYVVRVKAGKAKTELALPPSYGYYYYDYGEEGYRYGYRADATPRPARATQLAIDVPKDIELGKPVAVHAKTPYRGKVLWTVETDHVIASEWKDVDGGDLTWNFTIDQFAPNVYVSAFVVKDPHLESKDAFLPDRAFGVASARVVPAQFTQPVRLEAPKEVRSQSPLSITVDVGKPEGATFAMVAVVDEGILQLTDFQSPDPLAQLYAKRALGVETYETIGWTMLHQPASASSRTGGGDEGAEGEAGGPGGPGRVQPVHPVALFSGVVPVGADGKVTIPFQVPTYRGQLRVMAVTASATRVGHAETDVLVRDPLVVEVTFPRFVTNDDELQIPVFLTNMSGHGLDVTVKLAAENLAVPGLVMPKTAISPLQLTGKDTGSVHIDDGHSETLVFLARAAMPYGAAKLRVTAKAGALVSKDEVDVPFESNGPRERVVEKIKIDPGASIDLIAKSKALKGWVPTSEQTTFWLTSNPYGESFHHLEYLVHYPYGCIEQTTSSTRPLLYISNIIEQVDPSIAEAKIEDMVESGIQRVFTMQTPAGGFAYWPGGTDPYDWATAYATHMLLDAKQAGYAVPDDRLNEVLAWIDMRVGQFESGAGVTPDPYHGEYNAQSEAYLHYVLALAGRGKKARMLKLVAAIPATATGEQAEERYMLEAALYIAGDRRFVKELKAVDTSPVVQYRINSWSFYSDLRRRGFMLSTFHDLFGDDPAGELLAQRVAEGLATQDSYWYTTQELVWGVTGLGKWVGGSTKGAAAGKLVGDGVEILPRKVRAKSNDRTWSLARASEYKSLVLQSSAATSTWLVVSAAGVRAGGGYKTGGNGLAVTRTYNDLEGHVIDPAAGGLKLGDLVFVAVDIKNTSGARIQNIALVDRLPAGFEIENPRLGRSTKPDWVKDEDAWPVDFMNLRDDRIEAFGALNPGEDKQLVYTVRVVTSGSFTIPPVEAEAMYDPTLWARAAGGKAVVTGPWTGKTL
ncbi:MAG TPA: MG2 domain-containing protein [Kofleriaceae bacterium]|jgi:hypothetical protein